MSQDARAEAELKQSQAITESFAKINRERIAKNVAASTKTRAVVDQNIAKATEQLALLEGNMSKYTIKDSETGKQRKVVGNDLANLRKNISSNKAWIEDQKKYVAGSVEEAKYWDARAASAKKKKEETRKLPAMATSTGPQDDVKQRATTEPRIMGGPRQRKIDTNLVNVANTLYKASGFTEKTRLDQKPVKPTARQLAARIGLIILEPVLGGVQEAVFPFGSEIGEDRPATLALRVTGALATPTPADYVFGKVLGGTSSLLRRTGAKISSGAIEIPISNGGIAKWKGLYVRLGKHSKLLSGKLSLYDEAGYLITKIDDGTQILPAKGATRGYVPQTEIDVALTKDLMKMLEYTSDEFDKVDNVIEVIKSTKNTKSKFISDVLPQKTNTLSEDGVKAFIDFAKKNQDDVEKIYGSFAVKNQLNPDYNFGLPSGVSSARLAGDIDVLIKGSADDAAKVIERIYDDLLAAGENVRIDPNNPLMIQARVDNKWAHAIDGHAAKEINLDALYAKEWGFKTDQPGITIEDVLSQSAGEQSIKKGTSILGFLDDGTLGPVPHRGKDIVDFVHVSQTLEDSKAWWSKSVQDEINSVKELYGVVTVDDLDNIYAKLQKTEFVFKKSGGGGSLSPASFYASLGLPLGSVIASSSLAGSRSQSSTPSPSDSPSSPPSEPSSPPDEVSPPTEPPSPPSEPPSPPTDPPSPPSEPPSPPPDEPSPPPSQPGPGAFKKPKSKKRRKINLKLFRGPKRKYRVQHKYTDGTKTTVTVQAQSHPEAVAKAEGNRNRSKRLKEAISEEA